MEPGVILPIALAAIIAGAVGLFVQRASGALRVARRVEQFQQEAAAIGMRVDTLLGPILARVDAVRRHELDAGAIIDELDGVIQGLDDELGRAEELAAPPAYADSRRGMLSEIRHAQRALAMVQHGCDLTVGPRARSRSTESQISIKRGYLNLLHAREALARHVQGMLAPAETVERAWRTFRV
ncbi:MAG: hypothetical protein M0Z49_06705 [Chloroflexi bacterium]|nr:hypothetical protein [Chloroflexota bacterium]